MQMGEFPRASAIANWQALEIPKRSDKSQWKAVAISNIRGELKFIRTSGNASPVYVTFKLCHYHDAV